MLLSTCGKSPSNHHWGAKSFTCFKHLNLNPSFLPCKYFLVLCHSMELLWMFLSFQTVFFCLIIPSHSMYVTFTYNFRINIHKHEPKSSHIIPYIECLGFRLTVWCVGNPTFRRRGRRGFRGVVDRYMNSMLFALDDLAMAHEQLVTGLQQAGRFSRSL